ncbi:MAG: hypothetical protein JSS30_06175 [Verrucomicrobia bacterium]|nr:hypothetical protein [Verrucomicrobiota bacterium]
MKKLLITLGILMGCGVGVVLIAQAGAEAGGNEFDVGDLTKGGAGETFGSGPSAEERKAQAEEDVKQQLLEEYWQKKQAEGQ